MARILIVEDDTDLAGELKTWLVFQQHTVEACEYGAEALEHLQFCQYDIVILDGKLPDMDGFDLCAEYRSSGGSAPVLMLTGRDAAEARKTAGQVGATAVLPKPFHLKQLSQKIDSLVNGDKPNQQ